jgi:hypothetical protein
MILRVAAPGLAGMGDDADGGGRKTYPQLAAELKAVLDQVETNEQAKALGLKAFNQLQELLSRLGTWISASMVRSYLQPSLDHLGAALVAMPFFDGPVDEAWSGVPNGLRRAIQDAASSTWALQRVVPEGNLDAEDLRTFAEGFADTLSWELSTIGRLAGGLVEGALGGLAGGLGITTWLVIGGAAFLGWKLYGDKVRRLLA